MMQPQLPTRLQALWTWLLKRWLYVIAVCLGVGLIIASLTVFKTKETKEAAVEARQDVVLTKKEIRVLKKEAAKLQDSIKVMVPIVAQAKKSSDSTVVVVRKLEAKTDSLERKILRNETSVAADDDTPSGYERRLTDYKPAVYALPDALDSLR